MFLSPTMVSALTPKRFHVVQAWVSGAWRSGRGCWVDDSRFVRNLAEEQMFMSGFLTNLLQAQRKAEANCQLPRRLLGLNWGAATREIAIHFAQVRDLPHL